MVNTDQLTAGKCILALYSQEFLDGFLLTVGQFQKIFVEADPFVDVKPLKSVEVIGQVQLLTFMLDKGQIKIITVKMDQILIGGCEFKKGGYDLKFLHITLGKPLPGAPASIAVIGAADQIQIGCARGKSGGLDIQKQDLVRGSQLFQRILDFEVFYNSIICFHSDTSCPLQWTHNEKLKAFMFLCFIS